MRIELNKSFAPNSDVDGYDVRQMKKALNRLGYYMPPQGIGITDITDRGVFSALKQFQKERGLKATGVARPEDETVQALNEALAEKPDGKYIWRTVGDEDVRPEHAELADTVRSYEDSPDPGDDYNCRCWAEEVKDKEEGFSERLISEVREVDRKWTSLDFINHFYFGRGQEVSLEETGYLQDIIDKVHEKLFKTLASQIAAVVLDTEEDDFDYETSNSYAWLSEILWVFGGGTIRTFTQGVITDEGQLLSVEGTIDYEYDDVFTDVLDIRQDGKEGTSNPENVGDMRLKITDLGGTLYPILGAWQTELTGTIFKKNLLKIE